MPDRFYDGQPGPDIRRELNNLEAIFDDAIANAKGPQGWAPVVAVVTDDARRVLQITDWTGGEGSKPTDTGFIGATGIVATAALAVDIRGSIGATGPSNTLAIGTVTSAASPSATITGASPNQTLNLVLPKGDKGDTGNTGPANTLTIGTVTTGAASATITGTAPSQVLNLVVPQGIQGIQGNAGWSPIFATVVDGERRVLQLVDWTGGTGSKPATGEYVGATGLVATIAQAVDIRGPSGAGTGNVNPTGVIAANDLAAFADSTGQVIKALKAADLPVSTATQTALDGKAPLNGTGTSGTWPISTTGNAATATKLTTARTINGTAFDGSANISVSVDWASVTGKPAVIAAGADAAEARAAIGAGTSSLMLGTSAGTALAGDTVVLPEAPSDGKTYGRKDAAWVEAGGGIYKLPILSAAAAISSPVSALEQLDFNCFYPTGLSGANSVVSCGDLLVACTETNSSPDFATSPDGKVWTLRTTTDTAPKTIACDGIGVVVAKHKSSSVDIWVSADKGVTWVKKTNLPGNSLSNSLPAIHNGIILIQANTANTLYRSANYGITWTTVSVPFATVAGYPIIAVADRFVVPASSWIYYSSSDGITWTAHPGLPTPQTLSYSEGNFYRFSTNTAGSPVVETTDGLNFSEVPGITLLGTADIPTKINGMNMGVVSGTTWHTSGPTTRGLRNSPNNKNIATNGSLTAYGAIGGVVVIDSTNLQTGWFGD